MKLCRYEWLALVLAVWSALACAHEPEKIVKWAGRAR